MPRSPIAPLGLTTEGGTKFKLKGWKCYPIKLQCSWRGFVAVLTRQGAPSPHNAFPLIFCTSWSALSPPTAISSNTFRFKAVLIKTRAPLILCMKLAQISPHPQPAPALYVRSNDNAFVLDLRPSRFRRLSAGLRSRNRPVRAARSSGQPVIHSGSARLGSAAPTRPACGPVMPVTSHATRSSIITIVLSLQCIPDIK